MEDGRHRFWLDGWRAACNGQALMPVNELPPADAPARWSPEYLAAIVDSSDDAIIGKTLDGTIVSWNPGAERLYGYTPDEAIGRPISIIVPAERPDELPQILDRLRRGERIEHYRTTRVTKDGERITVSVTISPVRDASGTIIGASAIARDVGEHERAVEEALRLREDFISVVAHELRTPLTILYGRLQLVARRLARPDHDAAASRRDMGGGPGGAGGPPGLVARVAHTWRDPPGRRRARRARDRDAPRRVAQPRRAARWRRPLRGERAAGWERSSGDARSAGRPAS